MKKDKLINTAIKMRINGKSLSNIANELKIAKSTASVWLKKYPCKVKKELSKETRKKLSDAARRGNLQREYKKKPISELKTASAVRKRLFAERGRKCEECGWNEVNSHNGIIPVQVDHLDGDRDNNDPSNLKVVCPNCHSMTKNFMFYGRSHKGTFGKKGTKRYRK
jgi:transposase